jgi:hypothetical protein
MVLNENNRAVVFSNLNLETQVMLNELIIKNIDELSNTPLNLILKNFIEPEG